MEQSFVPHDVDEIHQPAAESAEKPKLPSYKPTPWAIVNRVLDIVDSVSGGRAGWVQRFFSFAFFGGVAAIVNLVLFYIGFKVILPKDDTFLHNTIAYLIAAEISVLANFFLNDTFTFRDLNSEGRSRGTRCLRYHATSISGVILTYLIQLALTYLLHIPAIVSQAIAIVIVLFYNFTFHHLFTYRHKKVETIEEAIVDSIKEAVTGETPIAVSIKEAVTGENPIVDPIYRR